MSTDNRPSAHRANSDELSAEERVGGLQS